MNTIANLTSRINNFDNWYMMSDDHSVYTKWNREEKALKAELNKLDDSQLKEVLSGLTERGLESDFGKVIKKHIESLPVAKTQSKLSKIMTTAWELIRSGIATNLSEGLKLAWLKHKTIQSLKNGITYLTFTKADGSTRKAIATLRDGNFSYESKGSNKKKNPSVIGYWDLEKKAFRACRLDRITEVAA